MANYLKSLTKTGNEYNDECIDDFTERICALYGQYGLGLPIISEVGVPTKKSSGKS